MQPLTLASLTKESRKRSNPFCIRCTQASTISRHDEKWLKTQGLLIVSLSPRDPFASVVYGSLRKNSISFPTFRVIHFTLASHVNYRESQGTPWSDPLYRQLRFHKVNSRWRNYLTELWNLDTMANTGSMLGRPFFPSSKARGGQVFDRVTKYYHGRFGRSFWGQSWGPIVGASLIQEVDCRGSRTRFRETDSISSPS